MCEVMACESDRNDVLYHSIKTIDDEILIAELQKRGYNLSDQHDDEAAGEIDCQNLIATGKVKTTTEKTETDHFNEYNY